ncbi:MAG: LptA/OstA family protein [Chthoniobacteraceae bacterium]|nr:LptA/OstA family protein [Chthoniobacteraceae bacterium]
MNKLNRPTHLLAAAALAALLLPVPGARAQNGFHVSNETGLELKPSAPLLAEGNADAKKAKAPPVAEERKATEITCTGETTFDAKAGMAVFTQDVKVTDPQFAVTADKLTVYLKKTGKEPAIGKEPGKAAPSPSATASPTATPAKPDGKAGAKPDAKDTKDAASGLERAVAEGHVIITQDKVDEKTGEVTHYVGKAAKADYNAVTSEMTLTGWPQIQQGLNNQVATEEGTVMILDRDGHMRTKGPSMTVIKSDSKPDTKPAKTP